VFVAGDDDVVGIGDDLTQTFPNDGVVVGDGNADHRSGLQKTIMLPVPASL